MSNSYSTPLTYGPQQSQYPLRYDNAPVIQPNQVEEYQPQYVDAAAEQKPSSIPAGIAGAALGAATGAVIGLAKKQLVVNGGNVNDQFAVKTYERYLKKVPDTADVTYEQLNKMLSKLNSVKTPEELKTLFADNPEAAQEACSALNKTPVEFLDKVDSKNLGRNKTSINKKLEAAKEMKVNSIKNDITTYWNADKKKFEKGANPDQNLYKAIKKTYAELKAKTVGKAAGIAAIIGGVALFGIHKLLTHKKDVNKNPY